MSRIIILVEGGVVQGVKSDDPFIDVAVLDMDNYREELEIEYNYLEFNI